MIIKLKNLIKRLNTFFIRVVLALFYFLIIGFISLIYRLFKKAKKNKNSHWKDISTASFNLSFNFKGEPIVKNQKQEIEDFLKPKLWII